MTGTSPAAPAASKPASRRAADTLSTALIERIKAEYMEMPGLRLTTAQAARLWNLSVRTSERVLAALVERRFLIRDTRGAYRRDGCPRCC
jgi:Fic family protein